MIKNEIKLSQTQKMRRKWDTKENKYYYTIIREEYVLSESKNPRDYSYRLKKREVENSVVRSTFCRQLKLPLSYS